ncbi:hydroxymethylglutaryl-CoA synthase family protein [Flavobacterium terrae]|uniref:Hydroxymethylglutaryl-CoA synthase n=1 Tax=Flavobacterium terrae TaxID=415425 RepID=A0A1M6EVC5_9FLAO|nr:hydroxymethylglutaryl-CoA synthase [Flavobacterium terrae]SHI89398.1 hydroxymethylglutaryl-CoA synthase [Flavobacterium terrae]
MKVGIDAIAFDLPKIYLPIRTLAENRNIEFEKLNLGLGLEKMSFPDVHQDVVTFAANATLKLIEDNTISPAEIDRIYVGTESGVDSSKPVASYVTQLLEQKLGENTFKNCDTLDMTFACIGAIDALQICLDFVRLNPDKKAIVIATDNAKYDLNSSGEYTQGAGAIAILIAANPRLISFTKEVGVSSQGVFDFFKPRRYFSKEEAGVDFSLLNVEENELSIYKEQPVFDGQYSNECYISRITEAYAHYKKVSNRNDAVFKKWENIIMHLPYCFQGRRTFVSIYANETKTVEEVNTKDFIKSLSKSEEYTNFVQKALYPAEIASSKIGNMYTGSIFLGLLSTLSYHFKQNNEITDKTFGFIAYGSGSKAKVFEGHVEQSWKQVFTNLNLFETIDNAKEIDFETYISLHKKAKKESVLSPKNEFGLESIENSNPNLVGARYYRYY